MTRIEAIAARRKAATKGPGHYQDFVANAPRDIRYLLDHVNYLLDELKDRDEKLAAAEGLLDENMPAHLAHEEDFGPHYPDPDWLCSRCELGRILHPKGE